MEPAHSDQRRSDGESNVDVNSSSYFTPPNASKQHLLKEIAPRAVYYEGSKSGLVHWPARDWVKLRLRQQKKRLSPIRQGQVNRPASVIVVRYRPCRVI